MSVGIIRNLGSAKGSSNYVDLMKEDWTESAIGMVGSFTDTPTLKKAMTTATTLNDWCYASICVYADFTDFNRLVLEGKGYRARNVTSGVAYNPTILIDNTIIYRASTDGHSFTENISLSHDVSSLVGIHKIELKLTDHYQNFNLGAYIQCSTCMLSK